MADRGRSRSPDRPGRRARGRAVSPGGSSGEEQDREDLRRRGEQARGDDWQGVSAADQSKLARRVKNFTTRSLNKEQKDAGTAESRASVARRNKRWKRFQKKKYKTSLGDAFAVAEHLLPADKQIWEKLCSWTEELGHSRPRRRPEVSDAYNESDDAATSDLFSEEAP